MKHKITPRFSVLAGIIVLATITRIAAPPLLGHPSNFAPIGALALFSGCYFSGKFSRFLMPLLAVWVGDLFVNYLAQGQWTWFYQGFYWQYGCYALIVLVGSSLSNKVRPLNVIGAALASSTLFFLVSNFGVWVEAHYYPHTASGLAACYIAGIPFYGGTLAGDLFYSALLFGLFELAQKKYTVLSIQKQA